MSIPWNEYLWPNDITNYNQQNKDYWAGYRIRQALLARDGTACHWCTIEMETGHPEKHPTIDHMIPKCTGAGIGSQLQNARLVCKDCNKIKANKLFVIGWVKTTN